MPHFPSDSDLHSSTILTDCVRPIVFDFDFDEFEVDDVDDDDDVDDGDDRRLPTE